MDVTEQCILKLRKRAIGAAVRLLMLEIFEKAFHHSVIVRIAFGRKRLDHTMLIQILPESLCCKLTAPIRMKHHAGRYASCSLRSLPSVALSSCVVKTLLIISHFLLL